MTDFPRMPPRVPAKRTDCTHSYVLMSKVIEAEGERFSITFWHCTYCGDATQKEPT